MGSYTTAMASMERTGEETGGFGHKRIKCFGLHCHYSRIYTFICWQYQETEVIDLSVYMYEIRT